MKKNIIDSKLEHFLRTETCLNIKRLMRKRLRHFIKQKDYDSDEYKDALARMDELEKYEKFFETPNTLWNHTCMEQFYSYMYTDVFERKEYDKINWGLKFRIAASVSQNRGFPVYEFDGKEQV